MRKTIGKFDIKRLIGKGATSSVYLGIDPFTGSKVAIKVAHQAVLSDPVNGPKFQKMFMNEASLAGKLRHPHIVSVYDAGKEDDLHYIVMEYVPGDTLKQACMPRNLLPFDDIVGIIFKCCSALDYAYHHGVIHRDIKPANLLIDKSNDVKVGDFGTALMENADHTQILEAVGSPAYMSPEQIDGEEVTHKTDIYSLGVVMYQLFCGHLPFTAKNQPELIRKIKEEEPTPLAVMRPDIPEFLCKIVERCLEKSPTNRYSTWGEVAQDITAAHSKLELPSEDVSDTEQFNTLKNLHFFHNFSEVELWEVVRISKWRKFKAERSLIKEGKIGDSLFILASGEARIMKNGSFLGLVETGQCFGEMAYIHGKKKPRSASVISNTDVIIIKIQSDAIQVASNQLQTSFNKMLLTILSDRLEQTSVLASLI
jgi:eukaryotic-like serine/threonine-protein kinase